MNDPHLPATYGAKGDGMNNDSSAFVDMFAAIKLIAPSTVFFNIDLGGLTYALMMPLVPCGGCAIYNGRFKALSGFMVTPGTGIVTIASDGVALNNVQVDGGGISTDCVYVTATSMVFLNSCRFLHWGMGGNGVTVNGGKIFWINCISSQYVSGDPSATLADFRNFSGWALGFINAADSSLFGGVLANCGTPLYIDFQSYHIGFTMMHWYNGNIASPFPITASISGTTLTVTAVGGQLLAPNQTLSGSGITAGTTIVSQTSGTPGGAGNYVINLSQTYSSMMPITVTTPPNPFTDPPLALIKGFGIDLADIYYDNGVVTIGCAASARNTPTVTINGGRVTVDAPVSTLDSLFVLSADYPNADLRQFILADTLLNVPNGPPLLKFSNGAAAFTGAIAGTILTVTAVTAGSLLPGQMILGSGVAAGTMILSQTSNTSGTQANAGSYVVSISQNVASAAMTVAGGSWASYVPTAALATPNQSLKITGNTAYAGSNINMSGVFGISGSIKLQSPTSPILANYTATQLDTGSQIFVNSPAVTIALPGSLSAGSEFDIACNAAAYPVTVSLASGTNATIRGIPQTHLTAFTVGSAGVVTVKVAHNNDGNSANYEVFGDVLGLPRNQQNITTDYTVQQSDDGSIINCNNGGTAINVTLAARLPMALIFTLQGTAAVNFTADPADPTIYVNGTSDGTVSGTGALVNVVMGTPIVTSGHRWYVK